MLASLWSQGNKRNKSFSEFEFILVSLVQMTCGNILLKNFINNYGEHLCFVVIITQELLEITTDWNFHLQQQYTYHFSYHTMFQSSNYVHGKHQRQDLTGLHPQQLFSISSQGYSHNIHQVSCLMTSIIDWLLVSCKQCRNSDLCVLCNSLYPES